MRTVMTLRAVAAVVVLNVLPQANAQPTVNLTAPVANSVYTPGSSITLSATATAPSGYTISKVEFFRGTTLVGSDTSSPYSFVWTGIPQGNFALTAKVTAIKKNNPTQTATSSPVNVIVTVRPSIFLVTPVDDVLSKVIELSANASDSDGTVASVRFNYREQLGWDTGQVIDTQAPYNGLLIVNPVCCADEFGRYTYYFSAQATDNQGATKTTAEFEVKVPRIAITSPGFGATFTAPADISIAAAVINGDGEASTVQLHANDVFIGTAGSPSYTFNWTGVAPGTYTIVASAAGASTATYVTVNPGLATLHYVHVDHLNTPRLVADQNGQAVWRWDQQEPFGVNVPNENPSGLGTFEFPLRFPGQYADKETNLYYNHFRDYDATLGRYIQSDPIGLLGGGNGYLYALASPLAFADPFGLAAQSCCAPKSHDECCMHWMSRTNEDDAGEVYCCAGEVIACVRPEYGGTGQSGRIIRDCVQKHEEKHLQQGYQCDGCKMDFVVQPDERTGKRNECEGYSVELACLRNKRRNCQTQYCRDQVNTQMGRIVRNAPEKYGCKF